MRVSPPASESDEWQFASDWESVVDTTDDEFMVQANYRHLQDTRQELEDALANSQLAQAGLEAQVMQLNESKAATQRMLEDALAEKTRLANELKATRAATERNQQLLREQQTQNQLAVKAIRKERDAALKKSSNEVQDIRAELNRLKLAPQPAFQTLGGRTVDELAEGLLRAFAGPKSNFVAGRSGARPSIRNVD